MSIPSFFHLRISIHSTYLLGTGYLVVLQSLQKLWLLLCSQVSAVSQDVFKEPV